jgi:hypothetical protein
MATYGTGGLKQAPGIMYTAVTVVKVHWNWIAAHVVFVVLCLILLFTTIASQRASALRGLTWKSSNLAVLHALDPGLSMVAQGISSDSDLENLDKRLIVRLRPTENEGWRLFPQDKMDIPFDDLGLYEDVPDWQSNVGYDRIWIKTLTAYKGLVEFLV